MTDAAPRSPGWYPDPATGGTRYSDGKRWTGDLRPPRRPFAAASANPSAAWGILIGGGCFLAFGFLGFTEEGTSILEKIGLYLVCLLAFAVALVAGIWLLRGQGPTTEEVKARLAAEEKDAKAKRRAANIASIGASLGRLGRSHAPSVEPRPDAVEAAQIEAITRPDTARALQNLQHLLYTRTITEAEYQAAKDKLFAPQERSDVFDQMAKLTELHRAGVLGDVEFAAAKARLLGL